MSDLTRYTVDLSERVGVPSAAGEWVETKEAEAALAEKDRCIAELEAEAAYLRGVWWDCSELHSRAKAVVENPGYPVAEKDLAEIVAEFPAPESGKPNPSDARIKELEAALVSERCSAAYYAGKARKFAARLETTQPKGGDDE